MNFLGNGDIGKMGGREGGAYLCWVPQWGGAGECLWCDGGEGT